MTGLESSIRRPDGQYSEEADGATESTHEESRWHAKWLVAIVPSFLRVSRVPLLSRFNSFSFMNRKRLVFLTECVRESLDCHVFH